MAKTVRVDVVTPDKVAYSGEAEQVIAPGVTGSLGILPGHAPLLTILGTGPVILKLGQDVVELAVSEGFMQAMPDKVIILAETAERAEEIDLARAEAALGRARAELKRRQDRKQHAEIMAALRRAINRIHVAQDYRQRKPERSGRVRDSN
ncbi:MAG: F0F1 ATP synthase subunit epsilon [Firmicutes bacterium]|jgi:F-type H+-transporting ATPase subunit epsilon|nr:F0F1 ATP synthase subunit epsilon [Bacillota bacterium]